MAEKTSLFPSPVKKKLYMSGTDFDLCVICQTAKADTLNNIQEGSYSALRNGAVSRGCITADRLEHDTQVKSDFLKKKPKWHRSCRATWTSKTNIHKEPVHEASTSYFTRQSTSYFDFKKHCVICGTETLHGKHRHEKLRRVETDTVQQTLYEKAKALSNTVLLLRVQGDDNKPIDMVGYEVRYHKHCYDQIRLQKLPLPTANDTPVAQFTKSFDILACEISDELSSGRVFCMSGLRKMYQQHLLTCGMDPERVSVYRSSSLKGRLEKRFGKDIMFVPQGGTDSELVCSPSITAAQLLHAWKNLRREIDENYIHIDSIISDELDQGNENRDLPDKQRRDAIDLFTVAQKIKLDVAEVHKARKEHTKTPWSVSYEEAETVVPVSLYNFLSFLLSENTNFDNLDEEGRVILDEDSESITRMSIHEKILNVGQDIVFSLTNAKTPKSVGLAVYVYHRTRSKDIITVLNRLGHSVSYTELQRILSSVAYHINEKLGEDETYIPPNISQGKFTEFAIDNLDFSECTLDGTSKHVTSMVMYQNFPGESRGTMGTVPATIQRRTSLPVKATDTNIATLSRMRSLKRSMHSGNQPQLDWLLAPRAQHELRNLDLCWAMARLCPTKLLEVEIDCPGWKVFHANISRNDCPVTSIGYCPFLGQSPTNPAVVSEALHICMKASHQLGLEHTVVTQDEAVYEISYTLRQKDPGDFTNLILRLGGFHLMMNFLGAIGKLMAGSGLKELFVDSKLLLEGTANKIMDGKGYYQAINAHMRVHEALQALHWNALEEWCLNEHVDVTFMIEIGDLIHDLGDALKDNTDDKHAIVVKLSDAMEKVKGLIRSFDSSRQQHMTHQLWANYMDMMATAIQFLYAEREAVWEEHISSTAKMLEIIAAADHYKYSKAVVSYLEEMRNLPDTAPAIYSMYQQGKFTVKRAQGKFNTIWTDMALECSQNCDAKGRSGQAGLKGVTLKERTQEKWFLTLPFTAAVSFSMKSMVHIDDADMSHHEHNKATQKREIESRDRVLHMFSEGDTINPFTNDTRNELMNIASGQITVAIVAHDLIHAKVSGRKALDAYIKTGKLPKVNICTMQTANSGKVKRHLTKMKADQHTAEMLILKRALLEKERGNTQVQMTDMLKYELCQYPPAISERNGINGDINLRTGNKSSLLNIFKEKLHIQDWPLELPSTDHVTGLVVDVMGFIRTRLPLEDEIIEKYADRLLGYILQETSSIEIHLVADRYDGLSGVRDKDGRHVCLKDASGCRSRRKNVSKEYQISPGLVIRHWEHLISNTQSKMKLLQFLFDRWSNNPSGLSGGRTLVLSGGFEERGKVVSIPVAQNYQQPDVSVHELSCNHEEADTRLFVHISACAKKGMKRIIIRASDTDITVVAIYKYPKLANLGLEELFIKTPGYFIPIHRISQVVTANQASSLPLMHALSGCDTSSFFFGKGKSTFWSAASKQNIESQAADI